MFNNAPVAQTSCLIFCFKYSVTGAFRVMSGTLVFPEQLLSDRGVHESPEALIELENLGRFLRNLTLLQLRAVTRVMHIKLILQINVSILSVDFQVIMVASINCLFLLSGNRWIGCE